MTARLHFECYWTDAPDSKVKSDFMRLANTVFGTFVTEDYYRSKFIDNIYGPSLVTVAYVDETAAGADVMWRNDLDGEKAYQTVDTCVLQQYRGMGIFKKITGHELETLGDTTPMYGFPNVNSYPGYIKMGWHEQRLYKILCLSIKNDDIKSEYAAWWIQSQSGISRYQRRGDYYLVRKAGSKPVATLIGRVDEATAKLFPETEGRCLLKYFDSKPSIYNKNKSIPLVCNKKWMKIPYWKIDAI